MEWLYDSVCLCGGGSVEEPCEVIPDEFMMVSLTLEVAAFDAWHREVEEAESEHETLGIVKSFVGRFDTTEGRFFKEEKHFAHVVHVFRKECYEAMKVAFDSERKL